MKLFNGLTLAEEILVFTLVAIGLGFVLNAVSVPLYRLLEGYSWPSFVRDWGIRRQKQKKASLKQLAESSEGLTQALNYEKFHRFPADDSQLPPTRLGSAIRAFETYGLDRYELDSQTWWENLFALAPEGVQKAYDDARTPVDFAVASLYLSVLYGVLAVPIGVSNGDFPVIFGGFFALVLAIVWYNLAVTSTASWAASVQAIVELARRPLADALGLTVPLKIQDERRMWQAATAFAYFYFDENNANALDEFRTKSR